VRRRLPRPLGIAFCATGCELLRTQCRDRGPDRRCVPFGTLGIAVSTADQDGGQDDKRDYPDFVFHYDPRRLAQLFCDYTPMNDVAAPRVGVGVIVVRDGLVLLGQRIGSHGAGTWALPGGHLEFGEAVEQCAQREVMEETGLQVEVVARGPYTSNVFQEEGKHYITLFVVAQALAGEPSVREPSKCLGWRWFRWSELPRPLFAPLVSLHASGFVPENAA
jgi:8-oxo-dGTP diphosphatase